MRTDIAAATASDRIETCTRKLKHSLFFNEDGPWRPDSNPVTLSPMPYFYCHLHGPRGCERDEVGLEFDGPDAAYLDVCRAILDMSADLARSGHDPMPYAFEIVDAGGVLLMDVPFREMLSKGARPERHPPPVSAALLRGEILRATVLRTAISDSIDRLSETIRMSRQIVARSRIVSAADPWCPTPPRGAGP